MAKTSPFETTDCGRCSNTGRIPTFSHVAGGVCFGCGGKGFRFTKRGEAANNFFNESLKVTAGSLQVGDLIRCEDFFRGKVWFAPIVEIGELRFVGKSLQQDGSWKDFFGFDITTEDEKHGRNGIGGATAEYLIRKAWSAEAKAEKLAAALAYQASMTKTGSKRRVAA